MLHTWRVQLRSPLLSLCLDELGGGGNEERNTRRYQIVKDIFDFFRSGEILVFFLLRFLGKLDDFMSRIARARIFLFTVLLEFFLFCFSFWLQVRRVGILSSGMLTFISTLSNPLGRVTIDGLKSMFDLVTSFPREFVMASGRYSFGNRRNIPWCYRVTKDLRISRESETVIKRLQRSLPRPI